MDSAVHKRIALYANLMEEAKVRIAVIDQIIKGRGNFHNVVKREFCYLQLRMLCELVALGCLVAHGDISSLQVHKVGKAYSADEIMKRLEELRPHFYPVTINSNLTDGKYHHVTPVNPHPFPKEELLTLYGTTHRYVHRGSLKGLLSSDTPIDMKFNAEEIIQWARRFERMLARHLISISADRQMFCFLRNINDNMRVQVAIADAVAGPPSSSTPD